MTRLGTTTRWVITAFLAAWMPLCFCQATGLVRAGMGLIAEVERSDSCCSCCSSGGERPVTVTSRTACCGVSIKIAPKPDRWSPPAETAGVPMESPLAGVAVAAAPGVWPGELRKDEPPPRLTQTLLRQHCALTI